MRVSKKELYDMFTDLDMLLYSILETIQKENITIDDELKEEIIGIYRTAMVVIYYATETEEEVASFVAGEEKTEIDKKLRNAVIEHCKKMFEQWQALGEKASFFTILKEELDELEKKIRARRRGE